MRKSESSHADNEESCKQRARMGGKQRAGGSGDNTGAECGGGRASQLATREEACEQEAAAEQTSPQRARHNSLKKVTTLWR